jgi:hypothetical protein
MAGITLLSEAVAERSLVSMCEDLWCLPFLVAIYSLPKDVNPWTFFVREIIILPSYGELK